MITLPIGLIGFFVLIYYSNDSGNWAIYLNPHAIMMVVLGTLMVLLIMTPMAAIKNLLRATLDLFKSDPNIEKQNANLMKLFNSKNSVQATRDELIDYALELWRSGISREIFGVLINQRREKLESQESEAIMTLNNLSKYPAALGMIGTVTGLVSLFSGLGGDNKASVGPALALALTATFFGLTLAHAVVMPLADRLSLKLAKKRKYLRGLQEILLLIERGEAPAFVQEEIKFREAV